MSIHLSNISKHFGAFRAVDDVSLTIPDGQLVALLGPSGSGKSTLLRIIAGLEEPDHDPSIANPSVLLRGRDVTSSGVAERGIGFVFQHYALFRHMSVFENVAFSLRVKPRASRPTASAVRDRVTELLKLMQLEGLERRLPSQLSGGQRQRVALARALASQPSVLLLDEPFGALDAKVRQDLRKWLRALHDRIHVTSVFVTHDQEEALELADRVVVMNKGRVEQEGTPEQVFHHPATPFVAEFLGNVNLFHGRIDDSGHAVFGDFPPTTPPTSAGTARPGAAARMYVRPHQVELLLTPADDAVRARVVRVRSAGPTVRVELTTPSGQTLEADLPHDTHQRLALTPDTTVYARPKHARLFVEDYAI